MDLKLYQKYQDVCVKTALEAGALLNNARSSELTINFQDGKDVKLKIDDDSEALIREGLRSKTGFEIIGEERGGNTDLLDQDDYYWVVDPLDGTYNFLRSQPSTCVSIGLMRGGEYVLGVIYDFISDNLYQGGILAQTTCNGREVKPKWGEDLSKSCLMTGFPAKRDFSTESLSKFIGDIQRFKKVRMIGSAALALAYVAMGYADAYYEEGIRLWDIAAGIALVKASGGYVSIIPIEGSDLSYKVWAVGRKEWL